MRFLRILLACVAAAGCSAMHSERVAGVLDPYVGQPVSAIVDRFGPPSGSFASSTVAMTYQWDHFGATQSGTSGCRILVVASRGDQGSAKGAQAFVTEAAEPEEYWKWRIDSWSSPLGSGCK